MDIIIMTIHDPTLRFLAIHVTPTLPPQILIKSALFLAATVVDSRVE